MVPVAAPLGRSERRVAAASYISGLLMPGQRKSIEPMAARLGVDPQRLQQFVADSPWDEEQLWRVLRREVIPHFEPIEAWIADETGWLKQGKHSGRSIASILRSDRQASQLSSQRGVGG